ncbi:MAG TPA: queuosine precursor transporter, partial [Treponemataceae bacterium]|nr:queuosine precursor transporter [Treponemataceae bacterium]
TWTLQAAFAAVLGPVWRIVLASIAAELVSELVDTEVYQLWVTKVTTKHQWARVLVSNAVSVPIDSIIFALIAFSGVLPQETVWLIVWANIAIKGLVTIISIPLIYLV